MSLVCNELYAHIFAARIEVSECGFVDGVRLPD